MNLLLYARTGRAKLAAPETTITKVLHAGFAGREGGRCEESKTQEMYAPQRPQRGGGGNYTNLLVLRNVVPTHPPVLRWRTPPRPTFLLFLLIIPFSPRSTVARRGGEVLRLSKGMEESLVKRSRREKKKFHPRPPPLTLNPFPCTFSLTFKKQTAARGIPTP